MGSNNKKDHSFIVILIGSVLILFLIWMFFWYLPPFVRHTYHGPPMIDPPDISFSADPHNDTIIVLVEQEELDWSRYTLLADNTTVNTTATISHLGDRVVFTGHSFGPGEEVRIRVVEDSDNIVVFEEYLMAGE